jgi:hypothetical protein
LSCAFLIEHLSMLSDVSHEQDRPILSLESGVPNIGYRNREFKTALCGVPQIAISVKPKLNFLISFDHVLNASHVFLLNGSGGLDSNQRSPKALGYEPSRFDRLHTPHHLAFPVGFEPTSSDRESEILSL